MSPALRKQRFRRPETPLPQPVCDSDRASIAWTQLNESFEFFANGAFRHRAIYFTLRLVVLVAGALVPIIALTSASDIIVAVLGAVVVIAEGTAQLTQAHDHWIRDRRAAEALRREAIAFCTSAGAYEATGDIEPVHLLAKRLLDIQGQESSAWESTVLAAQPPSIGAREYR